MSISGQEQLKEYKRQEFEEAVKPIHDWLCKYGDPYTTVAVMQDRAKQLSDPIPARGRQGLWEWEGMR